MKKVMYIRTEPNELPLTYGKIYDVIHYIPSVNGDAAYIQNDSGVGGFYYIYDPDGNASFKNADIEFRSQTIDEILK